jgi:peptide deformylase
MSDAPPQLKIVRYGHPVLRQKAAPVGRITDEVRQLIEHMLPVMREARGVGLAANQLGISRRIAVIEVDGTVVPLIDPEIVSSSGAETSDEGCLSLPRLFGEVTRPTHVVVRARDLSGKWIKVRGDGLLARALSHEIDHLNGRLFIDRADPESLHWLLRLAGDEEPILQPTTLGDALKAFLNAAPTEDH